MVKKSLASLALTGLLGACALPPQGVDDAQLLAFDEAVASIGCALKTESDYLPVELQTGLSREQMQEIATYRVATKDGVQMEDGTFRLVSGRCAPPPPAPAPDATVPDA